MKMSVTIACDCGRVITFNVKQDKDGLHLIESIDESGVLTASPTTDYTTLIRCVCGHEIELY